MNTLRSHQRDLQYSTTAPPMHHGTQELEVSVVSLRTSWLISISGSSAIVALTTTYSRIARTPPDVAPVQSEGTRALMDA